LDSILIFIAITMIAVKYIIISVGLIAVSLITNAMFFDIPWYLVALGALFASILCNLVMSRFIRRTEIVESFPLSSGDAILTNRPVIDGAEIDLLKSELNHNREILQNRPQNDIKVE